MQRITMKDLESVVNRINLVTKSPLIAYVKEGTRYVGQVGHYHLSGAYGGWCLHRMDNKSGGITTPINSGYVSKRELYNLMHAYLRGLES